jgi:hypothetical protein
MPFPNARVGLQQPQPQPLPQHPNPTPMPSPNPLTMPVQRLALVDQPHKAVFNMNSDNVNVDNKKLVGMMKKAIVVTNAKTANN